MRSRCTLAFGLLFASAVLADSRERGQSLPPTRAHSPAGVDSDFMAGALLRSNPNRVWVGLDGVTCDPSLRAGVDLKATEDGPSYKAWFQFYPDVMHYCDDITINAGDVVELYVRLMTTTSGAAVVTNRSNNQTIVGAPQSPQALCGRDARWMVQGMTNVTDGTRFPIVNFTEVTFQNAHATDLIEIFMPDEGASILNIMENGRTVTDTFTQDDLVVIKYV